MPTTIGQLLVNDVLPHDLRVSGPMTNKQLHDRVAELAKSDPATYVRTIQALKKRGDEIATLEGITVGVKDVRPLYAERDKIVSEVAEAVSKEKDVAKREKLVIDAQAKLLDQTKRHPGSMTHMALSGARGNPPQLMKIVATPLASNLPNKGIGSFLIRRSYAEGLTPAEYWEVAPEARANNVASVVSVSQPGEMAKLLIANSASKVVTSKDCGTANGVLMRVDDPHVIDRYLAVAEHGIPRNTLITPRVIQQFKSSHDADMTVRSPMTCSATAGVCQMCMGLDEKGRNHPIGTNVGVRTAQALAEPLTQMALGSKHAVLTIRERKLEPQGLKGVRQLLEIPQAFAHEALLAPTDGVVEHVEVAPQGGHYVTVGKQKLYARPELTLRVKAGDRVEAGDSMTDGVPHPAKLAATKGIGAAREHLVNSLQRVYANEGVSMDRRHFELLAKSLLNHVRLADQDDRHPEFLRGEVVNYNAFRDAYAKDVERVPVQEAVGRLLGQEVFHYTFGTRVTPSLVKELTSRGVKEVLVGRKVPNVEHVMKPLATNPLLDTDWMALLAHRGLKGTISRAASEGLYSDIHGTHPVPGYAYGSELRRGLDGTY
jgi:DNA-directed RNA polymerase subunit beta'